MPEGTPILVGVSHHTAPLHLREQFYAGEELPRMLNDLLSAGLSEAIVLFTCNRFEVYAASGKGSTGQIIELLSRHCGMSASQLMPSLYRHEGDAVVRHLMRVAAGLESLVLGEAQILGQVSQSLRHAQRVGSVGPVLSRLFSSAVSAGRQARTRTGIGRHTLSISHAAVLLVRSLIDLRSARVLVVGAGEMAALAARAFRDNGAAGILIANRTPARASALAQRVGGTTVAMENLPRLLSEVDAAVLATASPRPILSSMDLSEAVAGRRSELVLVDLGVPRNVDPSAAPPTGVRLVVVDELRQVVGEHMLRRQSEIAQVEALLETHVSRFLNWWRSRHVAPLLTDFRRQADRIVEAELGQALRRLRSDDPQVQTVMGRLARRLARKLLHAPTVALRFGEGADVADAFRRVLQPGNEPEGDSSGRSGQYHRAVAEPQP
ncbi:MAG: glutamyl-tRNA reductase [Phycisphaerae bacterium]|nr:glutamyl-tRNA reductase [Phycisphaerae bacterium]